MAPKFLLLSSNSFFPLLFFMFMIIFFLIERNKKSRTQENQPLRLPPGPRKLPIIGNLHQLGTLPHRSLFHLSQNHGPLMHLKLGSMPTVIVSSAETARQFLKTHDLDCCTRPSFTSTSKLSYDCSDIAFSPYGSFWREVRKICIIEFFSTKKVHKFQSIRQEEVERMMESISSSSSSKSSINLSAMLLSLSNDITCRAALGKRYYSKDEKHGLRKMLQESQAVLAGFFIADYVPALGWLDSLTGMRGRLDKNFHVLDCFYEKVIEEHKGKAGEREGGEDTMDALLRIQGEGSASLTEEHMKALLMNIFIGGSDTTSSAVEWAMTELMRHPEVMQKAQEEIRTTVDGKKGRVKEGDIEQLHYMKCVIKEIFRLHPPVPLLVQRETIRRCVIDGFDIPAKTRVIVNAFAVGREAGSWENPEEFRPERFMDCSIDLKGHDFELIPFGAGRRICPGMHVGMAVVELALANLLYAFDWELPEGVKKEDISMEEAVGITVHRKNDLCLMATKYAGITAD